MIDYVVLSIFAGLLSFGYIYDKVKWNGGRCKCGESWEYFDTDSQGGRGYACKNCNKTIWVSYPFIEGNMDTSFSTCKK